MRGVRRTLLVSTCAAVLFVGGLCIGQPAPPAIRHEPTPRELRELREIRGAIRPMTPAETQALARALTVPSVLDYSKYVTLIRNQGGGGGCGSMSAVNILDILKEREYPYCPDFSYRFNEWNYSNKQINQLEVERQYGGCSEASFPSNYDPPFVPPGPSPSAARYAEAAKYKIATYSDWKNADSVDVLKKMLLIHGPLFAAGDVPGSTGPDSHVFTLVGYDDTKQEFRILNSWGDQWGDNGFMGMPYGNITNRPALGTSPRMFSFRYVVDKQASLFHLYAGRVELSHEVARNLLTVKVGVEGRAPMVVWDRPQQSVRPDNSKRLKYDFPLPAYAAQFWPPNSKRQWYLEVSDSSSAPSETAGTVKMVTLVQRRQGAPPVVSRPSTSSFTIPKGGTVRIFVPSKTQPLLTLRSSSASVANGSPVVLRGTYLLNIVAATNKTGVVPQAGRKVTVYEVTRDPIEGEVHHTIHTTTTDNQGRYSVSHSPTKTASYRAIASRPDGTVEAVSSLVTVTVQ